MRLARVPNGGIQPRIAVDARGAVHLTYLVGDPGKADIYYGRSGDGGVTFSEAMLANSIPGSAVGTGTIRGAQMALGKNGRVHVAWNGSTVSKPRGPLNPEMPADSPYNGSPMLYARMADDGKSFEPQKNVVTRSFGLDGGGSVAADLNGNVYVAWHARGFDSGKGEAGRRVWIARSSDEGRRFAAEEAADDGSLGACGCCGLDLFAAEGKLFGLFRSATKEVHRDVYLLASSDGGRKFESRLMQKWDINACPMSSMSFVEGKGGVRGAWETDGQVYWSRLEGGTVVAAPGTGKRKHPRLAVNARGETLMVWAEGTGWQKGGSLAWQLFDREGKAMGAMGTAPGVPVWSFGVTTASKDGGFVILY